MSIKFITDSMAGLDRRYVNAHGITVLSRSITIDDKVFAEANMDYPMFYQSITHSNDNVKAIDIFEDEFFVVFHKLVASGLSIICTLASSQVSLAYERALSAKKQVLEQYPDAQITVIDSKSHGNQHGHITMVGVEYYNDGYSYDQIVQQMINSIEKNHLYLCPDIDSARTFSKAMIRYYPIFTIENGETKVYKNVVSRKNGIDTVVSLLENDLHSNFVRHITIFHVNNEYDAENLKTKLISKTDAEIYIVPTAPPAHFEAGIGTLGLSWNVV